MVPMSWASFVDVRQISLKVERVKVHRSLLNVVINEEYLYCIVVLNVSTNNIVVVSKNY